MNKIKIKSKSFIFLITIAVFTVLSFVFDQLVIRQETNTRSSQQLYTELENKVFDNYNIFFSYHSMATDLVYLSIRSSFRFEVFLNELINLNNNQNPKDVASTKNKIQNFHNIVFKDLFDGIHHDFAHIANSGKRKLDVKFQKQFDNKFKNKFDEIISIIINQKSVLKNYANNPEKQNLIIELYEQYKNMTKEIYLLSSEFQQEKNYFKQLWEKNINQSKLQSGLIKHYIGLKNLYILLSVASQILSLAFLCLLFKDLIIFLLNKKNT